MKRLLIVGSGQRVREAALPVQAALRDTWTLSGVHSRTPKSIEWSGGRVDVLGLDAVDRARLEEVDLVYLVVAKAAVPQTLARLASCAHPDLELLIETPVLLPKHLGHLRRLRAFRAVHVAEDCVDLPFLPAVRRCIAAGELGTLRSALLSHSAYAYHGLATLKALLGARVVRFARRRRMGGGLALRALAFSGGTRGWIVEPRDYAVGRIAVAGERAVLADHPLGSVKRWIPLAADLREGRCVGFRAGDEREQLSAQEVELMGPARAGEGLTVWMDGMKRVGLARMLMRIARGETGYPVSEAVDDALIDYHLEKLGLYAANPFTSANGLFAGPLRSLLTAVAAPQG